MTSLQLPMVTKRASRLRRTAAIRSLVRETHIHPSKIIYPVFFKENLKQSSIISPGIRQYSLDDIDHLLELIHRTGIQSILVFGIPEYKDALGSQAWQSDNIAQKSIEKIREALPDLCIIADVCCCAYTDHGHCGRLDDRWTPQHGYLLHDQTWDLLQKQSISFAQAGVDMVAPSGMIDGMVSAIRGALDHHAYAHIGILSYSAKYASCFYSPFRHVTDGAPSLGNRSTYQMDPCNQKEALREVALDLEEGADMLMVKPAASYLDVIYSIKNFYPSVPLCAYHTSGEFAMIKAAAAMGYVDEKKAMMEVTNSIFRAGADCLITYFADQLCQLS